MASRLHPLLRRKGAQRNLHQRPAREGQQSVTDDVLKSVEVLQQHVEQKVLDLPVGSLDQDEGAVTDLGGCSRTDRSQRPRRIVGQVLIKPSRLTSPAEVKALALRTQSYQVLLAHTLDRLGHLLRHGSRLALDGQNASCAQRRTVHPCDAPAHTLTATTLGSSTRDSCIREPTIKAPATGPQSRGVPGAHGRVARSGSCAEQRSCAGRSPRSLFDPFDGRAWP